MIIITDSQIKGLALTPAKCIEWVRQSFLSKQAADMPAKVSVHPFCDSFYTAMPCYHPDTGRVCVKVVSRVPGRKPLLDSKIFLFDAASGVALALIDANFITAARTGAVAALAAKTFSVDYEHASFGIVGLGVTGLSVLRCIMSDIRESNSIWLMQYKDHTDTVERLFPDFRFNIARSRDELIANTDTLFSCVTTMHDSFMPESSYRPGYTLIPVHVNGFQNCDTTFDKVFGDDEKHMRGWSNFTGYRSFCEFSDVLLGKAHGRERADERIISYNYGIALHDLWFSSAIYNMLNGSIV